MSEEGKESENITFWMVLKSVLAAMFGVQSDKNRQRDFAKGKPSHYILVGILAVLLFIFFVYGIVKLVLTFAVPS